MGQIASTVEFSHFAELVTFELVAVGAEQRPGLSCFRVVPMGPLLQRGADSHGIGRLASMKLRFNSGGLTT